MKKRILSVFLALSMTVCAFSGCSVNDKETLSYKTIEEKNVSFKLRSDVKETGDFLWEYSLDNGAEFIIDRDYNLKKASLEYAIEVNKDKDSVLENVSSEIIKCDDYIVIAILYDGVYEYEDYHCADYILYKKDYDLCGFEVSFRYPKDLDEKQIRSFALEIIESAEYHGPEASSESRDYDGEYFSIRLPDCLCFRLQTPLSVVVFHDYIDSEVKNNSSFILIVDPYSEYDSAEEYLRSKWDEDCRNIEKTEILGYDGYCFTEQGYRNKTEYAFEKNGIIYSISISVLKGEGQEEVQAEFEKLIDCIKIK
ncbi:MAG: hypothetical protein IJN14_03795 [Ruminococcus sp.]|nr:hypothetical protein [Ruminococcus sp.]